MKTGMKQKETHMRMNDKVSFVIGAAIGIHTGMTSRDSR
jgi:hypothetical protein